MIHLTLALTSGSDVQPGYKAGTGWGKVDRGKGLENLV